MKPFRDEIDRIMYENSYCDLVQEMLEVDANDLKDSGVSEHDIPFELYKKYASGYAKYQHSKAEVSTWTLRKLAEALYEVDEYCEKDILRTLGKKLFWDQVDSPLYPENDYREDNNIYNPTGRAIFCLIGYVIFGLLLLVPAGLFFPDAVFVLLAFLSFILYVPVALGTYFLAKYIVKKSSKKYYDIVMHEILRKDNLFQIFQESRKKYKRSSLPPKDDAELCRSLGIPWYDTIFGRSVIVLKKAYRTYAYFYDSVDGGIALSIYAKYAIKEKLPAFSLRPFYRGRDIVCGYDFGFSKLLIDYPWIEFPSYISKYLSKAKEDGVPYSSCMRDDALRASFVNSAAERNLSYNSICEIRKSYIGSNKDARGKIVSSIRYVCGDSTSGPRGVITLHDIKYDVSQTYVIKAETYNNAPFNLGDILYDLSIIQDQSLKLYPLGERNYHGILCNYSIEISK